jgi:hypothetical protein
MDNPEILATYGTQNKDGPSIVINTVIVTAGTYEP